MKANAVQLPPYARELMEAKRRRVSVNLFVHAGDHSWRRAKGRAPPHVLCLPPDAQFTDFSWQCVGGLDVTLIAWNREPEFVDAFARHLVVSGATLVAAIGAAVNDGDVLSASTLFYVPERAERAA